MAIEQNYFLLFDLPQHFTVDTALLSERYRSLQKELHPDRFAHQGEREQLRAVQATAHLNDAMATLKSPLKRAAYLLKLKGIDTDSSSITIADGKFLMQQMLLREQLEEIAGSATPMDELEALLEQVQISEAELKGLLATLVASDDRDELQQALEMLRKLQFFDKLRHEIELLEDQLADV
ncbi:MAG: Fe-S protein assembly co-chaperone HscB [Motiliproteus sp.]